ncbi:MAG: hypothetical protein ACK5LE_01615 [Alphaproteobacteria bacterium]
MKFSYIFISLLFFIGGLQAHTEGDALQSVSPSQYSAATIDINAIRRDSILLRNMYDEANKLSENLQNIIDQFQDDSARTWEDINKNIESLSINEREAKLENNQLVIDAKERFIVSRRIAIENAVARVDSQIREELTNNIIPQFAQENNIDVIFRNTQVMYSQLPDITAEILKKLNDSNIEANLELEILNYENVIEDINAQVNNSNTLPSVISPE